MKLLPNVDIGSGKYGMGVQQDITVITLAYLSIILYTGMLVLEIYNVYKFLYKQKKYKVYPVSLFYALAVPCTILRIISNFLIVPDDLYMRTYTVLLPAEFKTCIGFSQILVMIELKIRVEQSMLVVE